MIKVPATAPRPRLRTYLAAGYALLIVYASLSPFTGWQEQGLEFSAVLIAPLLKTKGEWDDRKFPQILSWQLCARTAKKP